MNDVKKSPRLFSQAVQNIRNPKGSKSKTVDHANCLIYAIGDIHGRHDLLVKILEKIRIDVARTGSASSHAPEVYMVFLGDYIDRGHQSKEVLESLCQLTFEGTEFVFLKGNHEAAALDFLNLDTVESRWLQYGGRETLASYGVNIPVSHQGADELIALKTSFANALPDDHLKFLRSLKSYWIFGRYMFVHAGVNPKQPVEQQTDKEYLWIRYDFLDSIRKLPYIIVHGHTPEDRPVWDGRRIGIDTGAYISNRLTAARLYNDAVSFLST